LWPIFVYSFLELISENWSLDGVKFLQEFGPLFEPRHADELRTFETITLPQHVFENNITKIYRGTKYRIPLNSHAYYSLINHLESVSKDGGSVILALLQTWCELRETQRGVLDQYSFEAIVNSAHRTDIDDTDLQEGIPGAFLGVTNKDILDNNAVLKLGPLPMEQELAGDVRAELEEEDARHPDRPSLVEEFDHKIKREEGLDTPNRNEIPYPPSRARDVVMEVQKIKEYRDRFKIEGRTGGIGPAVSVCMFTIQNSLDT